MGTPYKNPPIEVQLDQLESVYLEENSSAVRSFVRNNPTLLPLLWEARRHIAEYFGDHTLSMLEIVADPEEDDWEQLFVNIRTTMSVREGFYRLEEMIEEWQEAPASNLQKHSDLIVFDLEFV